jgi:NADH dehydrogenase
MKKRILITGCSGYIASNLIKGLKNRYKIICIGRSFNEINLYKYDTVSKEIKNCDMIIHLAAITNPFNKEIYAINVNYTRFLVNEAKKFNKKFIYLSTQNVLFGKDKYSNTKRQAEELVKTLKNYVVLRPTIIYGKGEDRYIGKLIRLIKTFPIIPIVGNGKNKLQPMYIDDLIKIIKYCINYKIKGSFLVAGSSIISYKELIDLLNKKLNLRRIKIYIPIWLLKPFAYLLQNFLKNPPTTTVQLDNFKINQVYDIKRIKKNFKINPKTIEQGLNLITKND